MASALNCIMLAIEYTTIYNNNIICIIKSIYKLFYVLVYNYRMYVNCIESKILSIMQMQVLIMKANFLAVT